MQRKSAPSFNGAFVSWKMLIYEDHIAPQDTSAKNALDQVICGLVVVRPVHIRRVQYYHWEDKISESEQRRVWLACSSWFSRGPGSRRSGCTGDGS